jgi:DNA-binding beta-propeller fold protein YncE
MIARAGAAVTLACAALAAGCGSEPPSALPPAAEPASSPPAAQPPAGRIVPVGNRPEGIAADPVTGRFAVGLREPAVLALVDGATGAVERRVPLPAAPRHLQRDGDRVLVPAEDADALIRVRFADGAAERAPTGREPHDAAAAAGRVFVADEFANGERPARPIPTALQPGGITPVLGGGVAVVAVRERVVELFDAATGKRVGEAPAGVGPTHAVADVNRLFVADTAGGAILVYRIRPTLELTRRVAMPGSPYGLAIDHRRHRLFVTQTARNQLTELTAEGRPHVVARYPTPRQPNTVAVDERTGGVAVTGKVDGTVQLLDPRDLAR